MKATITCTANEIEETLHMIDNILEGIGVSGHPVDDTFFALADSKKKSSVDAVLIPGGKIVTKVDTTANPIEYTVVFDINEMITKDVIRTTGKIIDRFMPMVNLVKSAIGMFGNAIDLVKSDIMSLTRKYEKPSMYAVKEIEHISADIYNIVVFEMDGYGNPPRISSIHDVSNSDATGFSKRFAEHWLKEHIEIGDIEWMDKNDLDKTIAELIRAYDAVHHGNFTPAE